MFGIETSRDLLAALHEDLAAFEAMPNSPRRAFHCATTAYHLHDWIWHEFLEKGAPRSGVLRNFDEIIKTRKDLIKWIERHFPWFQALADLVNGAKHMNKTYANTGVLVGTPAAMWDVPGAGWGQGRWGGSTPYDPAKPDEVFPMVVLSNELGGGDIAAWLLVKGAVDFWDHFFAEHVPELTQPAP